MRFDDKSGTCNVFTYKEGMLSAVAHDLKLVVGRWSLEINAGDTDAGKHGAGPGRIEATFDPGSVKVVCAMKDARPSEGTIGPRDAAKIEANVRDKVLEVSRHREIRFSGEIVPDGDRWSVRGELALHGARRSVEARVDRRGDELVTEVSLNQPDFGITPYSAMFGALKVQPRVMVRVAVPAPGPAPGSPPEETA